MIVIWPEGKTDSQIRGVDAYHLAGLEKAIELTWKDPAVVNELWPFAIMPCWSKKRIYTPKTSFN